MSDDLRGRCIWLAPLADDPKPDHRPAFVLQDLGTSVIVVVGHGNMHRPVNAVRVLQSSRFCRQWQDAKGRGLTKDTAFYLDNIHHVPRAFVGRVCLPVGPLYLAQFEVLYQAWKVIRNPQG